MTCGFSDSPNPDQGLSKWVQYDLGSPLIIGESWIWNINSLDHLGRGVKDFEVHYSLNGIDYDLLGSFAIAQGSGSAHYNGESGPDFLGASLRYILITLKSNHENTGCIGLGEIRFESLGIPSSVSTLVEHDIQLYPNPATETITIACTNIAKDQDYQLLDAIGAVVIEGNFVNMEPIDISGLNAGLYYFQFYTSNKVFTRKFSVVPE